LNNFQYHTEIPAEFSEMQIGPENVKLRQTSFYMNPKHGRASHNFYLSILVETGIMGLISILIMLISVFIFLIKIIISREDYGNFKFRSYAKAILAGFLSYLIYNIFHELGIVEIRFWILLILISSLYLIWKKRRFNPEIQCQT
ncbi:MAG: hypothetical protein PHV06_11025, partial [bacterium]|nr:hypothetical protein [bacterium]